LGCGLLSIVVMLAVGFLDELLLGGSPLVYGLLFVLLCGAGALWVRPADLITAPISAPIAFTAGLLPAGGGDGFGSRVVEVFTLLALQAGWLYAGTMTAVVMVILRKVLALGGRTARRAPGRAGAPRRVPRSARTARSARSARTARSAATRPERPRPKQV
jgi:hypothetical protein